MKGRGILKRTKKETITESSRTTRVKLYKSGKQWVQCLLTRVGLLKIATHPAPHKVQLDESEANLDSKSTTLLKGVLAAGAMIGGGTVASTGALAATTTGFQTTATNNAANSALANTDQVSLTSANNQGTTSQVTSTSGSLSTSETSTSTAATSTSASLTSNSTSAKEPASTTSTTSQTMSGTATSATSQTINANSLVDTTAPTTSNADQLKQLVAQANTFMATDSYKNAASDYRQAYQTTIAHYQDVLAKNQVSESDASYGLSELQSLMTVIDAGITPEQLATQMALFDANSATGSDNFLTPDDNTATGDTAALWNGNYKWIVGSDRLWTNLNAYTARNNFASNENDKQLYNAPKNIKVEKSDLGKGFTKWTITYYPGYGMYYKGDKASDYGLQQAQMGFYLTKDYQIIGKVNIHTSMLPGTTYNLEGTGAGLKVRNSADDSASGDVNPESDISFKPGDVNLTNGVISPTMNLYYHFGRYADIWHMSSSDFDNSVFSGRGSDKNGDAFAYSNEMDNANVGGNPPSFDLVNGTAPFTTSFNKSTIGTAMYLQSWGNTTRTQNASYTITFTTKHSNADQAELAAGANKGSFSGVYAIANSHQDAWKNLQGELVGQEVYNLNKDNKTIDSTIPSQLESASTSHSLKESESTSTSERQESESISTSES